MKRVVARWEAHKGKQYMELVLHMDGVYSFQGSYGRGVCAGYQTEEEVIQYLERGMLGAMRMDYPSTRRII